MASDQRGDLVRDADRRASDQLPGPRDPDEETTDDQDRDRVHVPGVGRIGDHAESLGHLDDENDDQPEQEQGVADPGLPQLAQAEQ